MSSECKVIGFAVLLRGRSTLDICSLKWECTEIWCAFFASDREKFAYNLLKSFRRKPRRSGSGSFWRIKIWKIYARDAGSTDRDIATREALRSEFTYHTFTQYQHMPQSTAAFGNLVWRSFKRPPVCSIRKVLACLWSEANGQPAVRVRLEFTKFRQP